MPDQPRHLAGMRRDDHVAPFPAGQRARIAAEGIQAVSVDNERHRGAIDEARDEAARPGGLPESRSDGHDVTRQIEHEIDGVRREPVRPVVDRLGHVLRPQTGDDGLAAVRRGNRDQTGA